MIWGENDNNNINNNNNNNKPIHAQNGVLPDMFTSVNHIDFGKQDTAQKFNMKV